MSNVAKDIEKLELPLYQLYIANKLFQKLSTLKTTNTTSRIQFLMARNPRAAELSSSDSGSPIGLQSRHLPNLQSPGDITELGYLLTHRVLGRTAGF